MLVEQPTGNQLALHLAKLLTDLPPLGSVRFSLLKLVFGELPMAEVRRRDSRSTLLGLSASAGPAMQPAPAILLICRTLTRGTTTCLRTAPLPRPVRPKPPLDTDGHVVFCQHGKHPACGVLLYRKFSGASRWVEPSCRRKSRGSRAAKLGALSPAKVSFGQLIVNSKPLILGLLLRFASTIM